MLTSIIAFIIVIAICVLVHEYGHYITARLLGVQVHEFAFGMGPVVKQIEQRAGQNGRPRMLWSWRLFPVGGFCRLAGMGEESDGEAVLPGMGFNEQSAWKRFRNLLLQFLHIDYKLKLTLRYLPSNTYLYKNHL